MNAIDIRGLCKKYPTFALQDVSFSVPQGAVMGFIGLVVELLYILPWRSLT